MDYVLLISIFDACYTIHSYYAYYKLKLLIIREISSLNIMIIKYDILFSTLDIFRTSSISRIFRTDSRTRSKSHIQRALILWLGFESPTRSNSQNRELRRSNFGVNSRTRSNCRDFSLVRLQMQTWHSDVLEFPDLAPKYTRFFGYGLKTS